MKVKILLFKKLNFPRSHEVIRNIQLNESRELAVSDSKYFDENILTSKKIDINLLQRIWFAQNFFWEYNEPLFTYPPFYLVLNYKDISAVDIIDDNNKTLGSVVAGAIVAGGLGAIANSLNDSKKYYIHIKLLNGEVEVYKCKNKSVALEFAETLKSKLKSNDNNTKIANQENILKSKLDEIKSLYENDIITKEEYESKRKKIIDSY